VPGLGGDDTSVEVPGAAVVARGPRRLPEPSEEEFVARMEDELAISLAELQRRTEEYDSEHIRLGVRADALAGAARGYLDVLAAQPTGRTPTGS